LSFKFDLIKVSFDVELDSFDPRSGLSSIGDGCEYVDYTPSTRGGGAN